MYRCGGDPSDFNSVVSLHNEQGLMTGFFDEGDPRVLRDFKFRFDAKINEIFSPLTTKYDIDVRSMGSFMGTVCALLDVTETYKWTYWVPFVIAVFIAMAVILKSLGARIIIFVVLMICVIFQYGWMGFCSTCESPLIKWTGNLNFYTMMMFGMVVGVGVDYSIYIPQRLRREFTRTGGDLQEALRISYASTGRAVFFTAVTFCLVLVPLMLTPLGNLFSTSLILIPDFVVAFLGSVFLIPAIYVIFKPKSLWLNGEGK